VPSEGGFVFLPKRINNLDCHVVPVEIDCLVHIHPPHLRGGEHSHAIQGSRVDDATETAELKLGEDFGDGDGVAVEVLQG
jgi:hypothetical protein